MNARKDITSSSDQSDPINYDITRTLGLCALAPGGFLLFSSIMHLDSGLAGRDGKTGTLNHSSVPKRVYDTAVGSIALLLAAAALGAGAVVAAPVAVVTIPLDVAVNHYRKKHGHGLFSQSNHNPLTPQKSEECKPATHQSSKNCNF